MNKGIAVAGNMIVDVLKEITRFPERHGLVKITGKSLSSGGAVCNVIRDLAALDPSLPLKALGMVGNDTEGDFIVNGLNEYKNIDTSLIVRQGQSAFTDVLSEAESKARTFLYFGGSNDVFSREHVDVERLDCDIFHIGYILLLNALDSADAEYGTKMARLLHDVQKQGILTSVDVVSEVGDRYKTLVPPALRYTDFFIINEIEAGKTTGIPLRDENDGLLYENIPAVLHKLKEMGVKKWAVIHAPEGGFGVDEDGEYREVMSLKLPDGFIKGSVGAGDAFCAGVLYAAYRGETLAQALSDGAASAACSLTQPGASEGMRPIAQVRALSDSLPRRERK